MTNQAGIAKGKFTESDFHSLVNWMLAQFVSSGACIDHVEFCPFHPDAIIDAFRVDSELRKPRPGMLLRTADKLSLDLRKSVMVGDQETDMQAACSANLSEFFWIRSEHSDRSESFVSQGTTVHRISSLRQVRLSPS